MTQVRKRIGIAIGFVAVLLAAPVAAQQASPVQVDAVRTELLAQTFPVLGRLVARQSGTVAALTRGPVLEVLVDVGDRVREGDVLVRLALDRLQQTRATRAAEVAESRAALKTARAQLELAQEELDRLEKLKGSAAFSRARYDDKRREVAVAQAGIGEAEANVARTRAELALSDIDLALGVIKAPFSGVVTQKYIERGGYVNVGDQAVALINDRDLEIEADVPSNRLDGLTPGRTIDADLSGLLHFPSVVRAMVPKENALTRTRQVRLIPDIDPATVDDGAGLAAGQTVTIHVPVGETRQVLTVHKDAVLAKGGGNSVYLVADGTVQPRSVTLGVASGDRFVVESGLAEGDLVVTRGNERLRPGQSVIWPEAETAATSGGADG